MFGDTGRRGILSAMLGLWWPTQMCMLLSLDDAIMEGWSCKCELDSIPSLGYWLETPLVSGCLQLPVGRKSSLQISKGNYKSPSWSQGRMSMWDWCLFTDPHEVSRDSRSNSKYWLKSYIDWAQDTYKIIFSCMDPQNQRKSSARCPTVWITVDRYPRKGCLTLYCET